MSKFEVIPGKKSPEDKILLYHGHAPTMEDVAKMCLFFKENEDRIYPPSKGFKGGKLFIEYIAKTLVQGKIPEDQIYKPKK